MLRDEIIQKAEESPTGIGAAATHGRGFLHTSAPEMTRCYLVKWSTLNLTAPDLYVDPNDSESQKQELRQLVAVSKERVSTLYGKYTATPIIIAGHTMDVMKVYGDNLYNRAGRSCSTPVAAFIVLGPQGFLDVNVLAHELAHAEFSARTGYWNRGTIPGWFDEGLAVVIEVLSNVVDR